MIVVPKELQVKRAEQPFGNDDANDWAHELDEVEDLSYVEAALDQHAGGIDCGVANQSDT